MQTTVSPLPGWRQRLRRPRVWVALAVASAAVASAGLLVVPAYDGACVGVATYGPGGVDCPRGVSHSTLLEENGPRVLWLLAIPVALTLLGVALRGPRARIAIAAALGVFALLTGLSIGGLYLPATIAMALAARQTVLSARGSS